MEEKSASLKWTLFSTILYGFCSGSMNFLNKLVLSVWDFHQPAIIMLAQMVFLALGLFAVKKTGRINLIDYTMEKAKLFIPLSFIYSINSVVSLSALTGMNIPMYNAVRRCVPIASLALGCCMLKKQKTTTNITISIIIITAGTFIAAIGDLDFHLMGYVYGMSSILLQALYLITLQKMEIDHKFGALSISYINSINCLPVMVLIAFGTGEMREMIAYEHWNHLGFLCSFVVLVLYGCLFTYSMFLCTTVNSALTTALVGVAKSAITTIVGMYAFGGVEVTTMLVLGQVINLSGGVFYSYEKYKLNIAKNLEKSPSNVALTLSQDLKSHSDLHQLAQVKVEDPKKHDLYVRPDSDDSHSHAYTINGNVQQFMSKKNSFSDYR